MYLATFAQVGYTIHIWNRDTFAHVGELRGHTGTVHSIRFSKDNSKLLSASSDRTVRFWDLNTMTEEKTRQIQFDSAAISARFSELEDKVIISVGIAGNSRVEVWDIASLNKLYSVWSMKTCCPYTDIAGDNILFVNGDHFEMRRCSDGAQVSTFPKPNGTLRCFALSPKGDVIAYAMGKTVGVYNIESKKEVAKLEGHSREVHQLCFSNDGGKMATTSHDGTVMVWDTGSWKPIMSTIRCCNASVHAVTFNPEASQIACGVILGWGSRVNVYDCASGDEVTTLAGQHAYWAISFSQPSVVLM
jgi:WD40 repeat protein